MAVKQATDRTCKPYECKPDDTVEAIILYPSLGMPMVLAPGQQKCSLIIATGKDALGKFGVDEKNKREAMSAYEYIDRHLRLTPIDEAKHRHIVNTASGGLYGDNCPYCTAQSAVKVWCLGTVKDGMLIYNRHGEVNKKGARDQFPIAVLAPGLNATDGPYGGWMTDLWEVELTLNDRLHAKIGSDEFLNWAWLVKTTDTHKENHKDNYFIKNGDHHEPQDRMIDAYLRKLATNPDEKDARYPHFGAERLFEAAPLDMDLTPDNYPIPGVQGSGGSRYATRLQSCTRSSGPPACR
jgi:hypothetical protein